MTLDFAGFHRGPRGIGTRDVVLVVPSVGCTNRVVELISRARPDVRVVTHQHGCGQLGDDLRLTREVLARTLAHPNVAAGVIVGLGCETNAPRRVHQAATALGAAASVVVFQDEGGAEATVRTVLDALARAEVAHRQAAPAPSLRIAVIADAPAEPEGGTVETATAAISAALAAAGADVEVSIARRPGATSAKAASEPDTVPVAWRGRTRSLAGDSDGDSDGHSDLDTVAPTDVVEALSVAVARGATVVVMVTDRMNLLGSPVVPTLKVAVDPGASLTADITLTPASSVEAVVAAVAAVASGQPVVAESMGQRDFAIPRLGPST